MANKKRWEDRVFDFILRKKRRTIDKILSYDTKIYVGQKIIYKTPVNNRIMIHTDTRSMRRFALIAFGLCVYIAIKLFLDNHKTWGTFLLVLLITFPFWYTALTQFIQSRRKKAPWYIDLQHKKIALSKIAIPFHYIQHFNITRLQDANEFISISEYDYSYQLNITLKDGQEIMLFTDDHKMDIDDAAEFFIKITGIELQPKVTNA